MRGLSIMIIIHMILPELVPLGFQSYGTKKRWYTETDDMDSYSKKLSLVA